MLQKRTSGHSQRGSPKLSIKLVQGTIAATIYADADQTVSSPVTAH